MNTQHHNPLVSPDSHQPQQDVVLALLLAPLIGSVLYLYLQQGVWLGLSNSPDFYVFYTAGDLIRRGRADLLYNIDWFYAAGAPGPYLYFPFLAILLAPLSMVSYGKARIIWMILNQCALIGSIVIATGREKRREALITVCIALLCLGFGPMIANMYWGQSNVLILLCILVGWRAYKRDYPVLCGVSLALATIIKVSPAILGVYFLYKREYRVVLWSAISFIGLVLASMVVLGGYAEHYAWLTTILPFLSVVKGNSILNQSFDAFYLRLAANGLFTESVAHILHTISSWLILLVSFGLCRFNRLYPDSEEFDLEYACIASLLVLVPVVVIVQHYVFLLIAYILVLLYLVDRESPSPLVYVCYGVSYTAVSLGAFGGQSFTRWPFVLFQSPKLLGSLLLWGLIAFFLLKRRSHRVTPKSEVIE